MSEAFERERQNNDSLAALQSKVSQLRHVTVDIYDQARDQGVIDSTSETFSTMTTSLKGSARRLGTMASQGNKVAILKLAGMVIGAMILGVVGRQLTRYGTSTHTAAPAAAAAVIYGPIRLQTLIARKT
ncbi:hypothetical protein D0864_05753 [Hortaea werneckii]|uniref:t-SNARE coiled-coil homology domain-containing protein n=1 Tax=Hortaea werneckii TaxID=91943 RepID=A0A3M7FM83_HORWE|nr:hypothetical protein D0862_10077 [Hortaea werneckii]RMY93222.1 hypothetical protein D0864_05753 [Hortaea werneckii]